ncbi:bifunctional folylpolyglutamate synthase/dihydrofolate synthase [Peptostreptococcus equinus]|uniref:tetrahydrofolate synthase n=1 Tax=Peptostreptococcus equinus TaxID=3003601 RepID=A0ABY7JQ26_9FIRM|nr:folylpolyglutamate synthase/dihydrofolate synthase family protein [Peptostreptococcus sp. CBA3647]WAW15215.1 bifunctional folylpolyglutamate synthase/dihydrofolate synthase [Peptostreptococcus sp. CBA3647]
MKYEEALSYIHNISKLGMVFGLDSVKELLRRLGNPQDNMKYVHIAGTNGKGSTASFIANALIESGYNVGLYTSPYLERFNERIRLNNEEIEDQILADCVEVLKKHTDQMLAEGLKHPTEFDFVTALAFYYYSMKKTEIVVLEVGLGGRSDSTNVIKESLLSVIASISLDHINILGNTIEEIAYEKAGIIKENSAVMVYGQEESVIEVIKKEADLKSSNMMVSNPSLIELKKSNLNNQIFDCTLYDERNLDNVKIRLIGKHQVKNALLSLNALEYLKNGAGLDRLNDESIYKAFLNTKWPGRFEMISDNPYFVIDGAHNKDSARCLSEEVGRLVDPSWEKILVLGLLKDKDVDSVVKLMVPKFDYVILTKPENPRAMEVEELAYRVGMYTENIICIEDVEDACKYAIELANSKSNLYVANNTKKVKSNRIKSTSKDKKKNKIVFVAGSLYLVGKVRTVVNKTLN